MASRSTEATSPKLVATPISPGRFIPWGWIVTAMRLGKAATVVLTTAAWFLAAGR